MGSYDTGKGSQRWIATVAGRCHGNLAKTEWTVKDLQSNDQQHKPKIEFDVTLRTKTTRRCEVPMAQIYVILIELDVDDPKAKDDQVILWDENNQEVDRIKVSQMKEYEKDCVMLVFEDLDPEKRYSLIRDRGQDEAGRMDPLVLDLKLDEMLDMSEE